MVRRSKARAILTEAELAMLAAWSAQGAPPGDLASAPPPPVFPDGWQLGTPDLVLRADATWTMPAEGPDFYRNFVFRVPVTARRFVAALEIVPGNRRVTHHANVYVDHAGWARARDAEDPEPGFPGMDLQIASNRFDPESHFLFYKPGTPPAREPADMAWPIEPGDDLVLNLHLRPSGKPETVQPSLGLYFTERAPTRHPMLLQLEDDRALDIPPGAARFAVGDALTLPVAVQLVGGLSARPLARPHGRGAGDAARTAGASRSSASTTGTRRGRACSASATRSRCPPARASRCGGSTTTRPANPRNPHTPPARVRAGDQSTDEMAHVWLQVIPASRDDLPALQEAVMRHRLERYPGDFSASANLAAVLQTRGRLDEAIAMYRQAVRARPDVASIRNALGTALQAGGALDERDRGVQRGRAPRPRVSRSALQLGQRAARARQACGRRAALRTCARRGAGGRGRPHRLRDVAGDARQVRRGASALRARPRVESGERVRALQPREGAGAAGRPRWRRAALRGGHPARSRQRGCGRGTRGSAGGVAEGRRGRTPSDLGLRPWPPGRRSFAAGPRPASGAHEPNGGTSPTSARRCARPATTIGLPGRAGNRLRSPTRSRCAGIAHTRVRSGAHFLQRCWRSRRSRPDGAATPGHSVPSPGMHVSSRRRR